MATTKRSNSKEEGEKIELELMWLALIQFYIRLLGRQSTLSIINILFHLAVLNHTSMHLSFIFVPFLTMKKSLCLYLKISHIMLSYYLLLWLSVFYFSSFIYSFCFLVCILLFTQVGLFMKLLAKIILTRV